MKLLKEEHIEGRPAYLHFEDKTYEDMIESIGKLDGWFTGFEGHQLIENILSLPKDLEGDIAEVGSYMGKSSVALAYAAKQTNRKFFAIDHFMGSLEHQEIIKDLGGSTFNKYLKTLQDFNLYDNVYTLAMDSHKVSEFWNRPLAFFFIDGTHSYEGAMHDYMNFKDHIVKGGLLALHDIHDTFPGVLQAYREILQEGLFVDYWNQGGWTLRILKKVQ